MKFVLRLSLLICCVMLSSCVTSEGFDKFKKKVAFWSESDKTIDFTVHGIDDDDDTKQFIERILKQQEFDRLDNPDEREYALSVLQSNTEKALQSKGYYEAEVSVTEEDDAAVIHIDAGEPMRIGSISINPSSHKELLEIISIKEGDVLDAAKVLADQGKIYNKIQEKNCAFSLSVKNRVSLNGDTNRANIVFDVLQGKAASFGDISFTGQKTIDKSYLDKLISIEEGKCFQQTKIQSMRDEVMSTGLFSRVETVLPKNADGVSVIPVEFALTERKHRTVRAGMSYYTDEGLGLILGWQHRNFLGSAEKLDLTLKLSQLEQSLGATMSKPFFMRKDQSLNFHAGLKREDTDAYEQFGINFGGGIKRKFNKRLSADAGLDFEITRITEENDDDQETFALFNPYVGLTYDSRDNALDPHKGWLIGVNAGPTIDLFGQADPYVKTVVKVQTYKEVHEKLVLAARTKLGTIWGGSSGDLPATERFFAGGGGSVRGFGYQEVGPFQDGDPLGGRSVFEASLETRFKFTDTLGGVLFADAGQVSDEVTPSFSDMAIGAGAGFRYYTGFGPLRFDVGVPLSGDENTSDNFQVYISIGQSF